MFTPRPFHTPNTDAIISSYLTKKIVDSIEEYPNIEEAVTTFLTYLTTQDCGMGDYSSPEKANISKYTSLNLFFAGEGIDERAITVYNNFVNSHDSRLPKNIRFIINQSRSITLMRLQTPVSPEVAQSSYVNRDSYYEKAERYYREQTGNNGFLTDDDLITIHKMTKNSYGFTLSFDMWGHLFH